jgi:hypothetical protein
MTDPIVDKCDMCEGQKNFKSTGTMIAGKGSGVRLESWLCTGCDKFSLLYALSESKTFLISKTYEHKFITIRKIYDPFTKEVNEIKISKKDCDINLVLKPDQMIFDLDPLRPNEELLLMKLEVYEIFS